MDRPVLRAAVRLIVTAHSALIANALIVILTPILDVQMGNYVSKVTKVIAVLAVSPTTIVAATKVNV